MLHKLGMEMKKRVVDSESQNWDARSNRPESTPNNLLQVFEKYQVNFALILFQLVQVIQKSTVLFKSLQCHVQHFAHRTIVQYWYQVPKRQQSEVHAMKYQSQTTISTGSIWCLAYLQNGGEYVIRGHNLVCNLPGSYYSRPVGYSWLTHSTFPSRGLAFVKRTRTSTFQTLDKPWPIVTNTQVRGGHRIKRL